MIMKDKRRKLETLIVIHTENTTIEIKGPKDHKHVCQTY